MKVKRKYTEEVLRKATQTATSFSDIMINLGLKPGGSMWQHIKWLLRYYNISIDHLSLGSAWAKGKTAEIDVRVAKCSKARSYKNEEIFVENSPPINGTRLLRRLKKRLNLDTICCESCGQSMWLGEPIVLHVHHDNGIRNDNRIENLKIVCLNCHAILTRKQAKQRAAIRHLACEIGFECLQCKKGFRSRKRRRRFCSNDCSNKYNAYTLKRKTKISWPPITELHSLVKEHGYRASGRILGVSDNAIRKHLEKCDPPVAD